MKKLFLITLLATIVSGCCIFGNNQVVNQQCSFEQSVCQKNVQALQNGLQTFMATGGAYIVKDMDSGEVLENTYINFAPDTVYETYFSKIKFDNKTSPEKLLNKYINLVKTAGKGLQRDLRNNVTGGTARKANIAKADIYGTTATTEKDSDKIVITTFIGHFVKDKKRYAYIFVMDEPKGLKQTYGWRTAGWNIVPTAAEVIKNIGDF